MLDREDEDVIAGDEDYKEEEEAITTCDGCIWSSVAG